MWGHSGAKNVNAAPVSPLMQEWHALWTTDYSRPVGQEEREVLGGDIDRIQGLVELDGLVYLCSNPGDVRSKDITVLVTCGDKDLALPEWGKDLRREHLNIPLPGLPRGVDPLFDQAVTDDLSQTVRILVSHVNAAQEAGRAKEARKRRKAGKEGKDINTGGHRRKDKDGNAVVMLLYSGSHDPTPSIAIAVLYMVAVYDASIPEALSYIHHGLPFALTAAYKALLQSTVLRLRARPLTAVEQPVLPVRGRDRGKGGGGGRMSRSVSIEHLQHAAHVQSMNNSTIGAGGAGNGGGYSYPLPLPPPPPSQDPMYAMGSYYALNDSQQTPLPMTVFDTMNQHGSAGNPSTPTTTRPNGLPVPFANYPVEVVVDDTQRTPKTPGSGRGPSKWGASLRKLIGRRASPAQAPVPGNVAVTETKTNDTTAVRVDDTFASGTALPVSSVQSQGVETPGTSRHRSSHHTQDADGGTAGKSSGRSGSKHGKHGKGSSRKGHGSSKLQQRQHDSMPATDPTLPSQPSSTAQAGSGGHRVKKSLFSDDSHDPLANSLFNSHGTVKFPTPVKTAVTEARLPSSSDTSNRPPISSQ